MEYPPEEIAEKGMMSGIPRRYEEQRYEDRMHDPYRHAFADF